MESSRTRSSRGTQEEACYDSMDMDESVVSDSRSRTRGATRGGGAATQQDSSPRTVTVVALASLQTASGSFPPGPLASLLGLEEGELGGEGGSTALALAWLEEREAGREEEWQLVAEKGRRWLEGRGEGGLLARAKALLRGEVCPQGHPLQVTRSTEY